MRIGIGYDIHRLVEERPFLLGGVRIPFGRGPEGHSDADVLIHSIMDAMLGAMGEDDIGVLFPDSDPGYKGISSKVLLKQVSDMLKKKGCAVENIDSVVIAEEPKIAPFREAISASIASVIGIPPDRVSVKGKTGEGLGATGRGEAVAAYAVVLIEEKQKE